MGRVVWKHTYGQWVETGATLNGKERDSLLHSRTAKRTSVNMVGTQKVFSKKMEGGGEEEKQCLTPSVFEKENA